MPSAPSTKPQTRASSTAIRPPAARLASWPGSTTSAPTAASIIPKPKQKDCLEAVFLFGLSRSSSSAHNDQQSVDRQLRLGAPGLHSVVEFEQPLVYLQHL